MPRFEMTSDFVTSAAAKHGGLRPDPTRTRDYQRVQAARAYKALRAEVAAHVETVQKAAAANYAGAYRRRFGIDDLPGDKASLHASMRQATAEASEIGQLGVIASRIKQAQLTGDVVMARALARRACELQDVEGINALDIPDLASVQADIQLLFDGTGATEELSLPDSLAVYGALADHKPEVLAGTSDYDIDRIVSDADAGDQATA